MNNIDLFLELANPDIATGVSRWVKVSEFVGRYSSLKLGNGFSWGRRDGSLAKRFNIEVKKDEAARGRPVVEIRLNGYNREDFFDNAINPTIKNALKDERCVMLGIAGTSQNVKIEIDHKDGRKNDARVGSIKTQRITDFQPLCKAANDAKRQICKECAKTGIRWDAKNIPGNPYSFYAGDRNYTEDLGCVGCYQYDPVAYRKWCVRKLLTETDQNVYHNLYPEG